MGVIYLPILQIRHHILCHKYTTSRQPNYCFCAIITEHETQHGNIRWATFYNHMGPVPICKSIFLPTDIFHKNSFQSYLWKHILTENHNCKSILRILFNFCLIYLLEVDYFSKETGFDFLGFRQWEGIPVLSFGFVTWKRANCSLIFNIFTCTHLYFMSKTWHTSFNLEHVP